MAYVELVYNQALVDKLIQRFGTTASKKDGGFILPDGQLLNLNRSNMSVKQYHREVAALLPKEQQGICDEISIINLMNQTCMIRYEAKGRVHVAVKPTAEQRRKIFEIMKYSEHDYLVIVSDKTGATIGQQRFKSPQAHELLQFFTACFDPEQKKNYISDEFSIHEVKDGYELIFRTSGQVIGHYDREGDRYEMDDNFSDLIVLFQQKVDSI